MDSSQWDQRYAGSELLWTAEANRFLVQEAEGLQPRAALDLACGEGRNAVWLAQQGWRVTGVDFSKVALRKAQQLADARRVSAHWIHADLLEYRPEPRSSDLVLILYLHVPAEQRPQILGAAADAVAPGGVLLLVGHDRSNLDEGYGGPQSADVLYTADEVVSDLEPNGLAIERAERIQRPVQTAEGERIALDLLVRARRAPAS